MARGKTYLVAHRRRREGRTNYHKRFELVKSGKHRLVVRKARDSLVCQIVFYRKGGDLTVASATTKDLSAFGWKGGAGNIPSSYLVGYLCGMRSKARKVNEAILDIGIQRSTPGSRIYAALKGAVDAGLDVPFSEEILPSEERIRGTHISNISKVNTGMFSGLKKAGLDPKDFSKHFDETKAKIGSGKHESAKPAKAAKTEEKAAHPEAHGEKKAPPKKSPAKAAKAKPKEAEKMDEE
jgi:large subunit ribosomal protein L18